MPRKTFISVLLASAILVQAQDCPTGYEFHTGSVAEGQTVDWTPCPVPDALTLECGTLQVPLDYTDTEAGVLTLSLVRVPADPSVANGFSILMNPGGPGESGVSYLAGGGEYLVTDAGGAYHIVSWDPRGVGLTIPYQCPQLCPGPSPGTSYNDEAYLNDTLVTLQEQGDFCDDQKTWKTDGELVGTAFTARDVLAISEAVNPDGLIRFWGFSYGTLLGATIAAMFPDKIDRMVLDGNINPTEYYHGANVESVDDIDATLDLYFTTCANAGPDYCALAKEGWTGADLRDEFLTFIGNLKAGTSTAIDADGFEVTYVGASGLLYGALARPSTWATVAGNFSQFYSTEVSTSRRDKRDFDPLLSETVLAPQALSAISCGDFDEITADLAQFEEWLAEYQERSSFGGDQLIGNLLVCSTWTTRAKERFPGLFEGIVSKTPILFVNGPYDPLTPLVSAQNASAGFVDSVVLQHMGAGHCSSAQPSACTNQFVAAYFNTAVLPDPGTVCQPDFDPFSDEPIVTRRLLPRSYPQIYPKELVGITEHARRHERQYERRQETQSPICDVYVPEVAPIPATCTALAAQSTPTETGGAGASEGTGTPDAAGRSGYARPTAWLLGAALISWSCLF